MSEIDEDRLQELVWETYFPIFAGITLTHFFGVLIALTAMLGYVVGDRIIAKLDTGSWIGETRDLNKSEENGLEEFSTEEVGEERELEENSVVAGDDG